MYKDDEGRGCDSVCIWWLFVAVLLGAGDTAAGESGLEAASAAAAEEVERLAQVRTGHNTIYS